MKRYRLDVLPDRYAVLRMAPDATIPTWVSGPFVSISRTPDELSIVCRDDESFASRVTELGMPYESAWRCLRVVGPLPFDMIGVIATLSAILAKAEISVFVVSTFDTDYLFVEQDDLPASIHALVDAGHAVAGPSE